MMLFEVARVPDAALPMEAFKAHLRLGTGFSETALQEPVLRGFLRAAIATIEARTGKVLLRRVFEWSATRWPVARAEAVRLPLAPVAALERFAVLDAGGGEQVLELGDFQLMEDMQSPQLRAVSGCLPELAQGSKAVLRFTAGFGATWDDVPEDLAQAVFLLAAHYYEFRDETALSRGCMPFGVQSLIERYRPVRIGFGALT